MKNKYRVLCVLLTLCAMLTSPLFAAPYDLIPVGDPALDDLLFLSRESGNAFLSFIPPVSPGEAEIFLDTLDPVVLSGPAREAYYRVRERLRPTVSHFLSSDAFSLSFDIVSTVEAKARFNTDITFYPDNTRIPALLSVPLQFYFFDFVLLYMEPTTVREPEYYPGNGAFGINVPFSWFEMDSKLPVRAFITAGGSWWNFQLGRDRLFYGTGHTGSLSISDNPDYYEFARLSFFSRYLKYSFLVNQMPLTIPDVDYNNFIDQYNLAHPGNPLPNDLLKRSNQRYFYLHRFDFKFGDAFSVSAMEGLMVGNAPLELRYLNPLSIFHAFYSWEDYDKWTPDVWGNMNGSFLSLELNWNIVKSLSVYGQYFMNEFATPLEFADNPDQPPNGVGFLAGINYSHSFTNWGSSYFLEFVYTSPYAYINPTPFASLIYSVAKLNPRYYNLGYPRDTITCTLGTQFFNGEALRISGEFSWIAQGEHASEIWTWGKGPSFYNELTPTGTAEHKFIFSGEAEWKVLPFLILKGSLAGIIALNNNNVSGSDKTGGQAALSVTYRYR